MADLRNLPWNQFMLPVNPEDQISDHFMLAELIRSEIAARHGIDNSLPGNSELQGVVYVCRNILQPIRDWFGSFTPNSVYRCQEVEQILKNKPPEWISDSQHTKGQACDIEVPGISNRELVQWIIDNLEFDQLILECYNPAIGPNSGWIHVSLVHASVGINRFETLSYIFDPAINDYRYVDGIVDSL